MMPSNSTPKLPTWIFILTDAVLVGIAWFIIGRGSPAHPPSTVLMLTAVGCVLLGAVVALVPIVAHYERQKNEALDERQRALESLSQSLHASAEQISIAASGLHAIAELAQKTLRHAEQLPHKLQDKIAEFQSQLAAANDAEKEELEKELVALRTSESERLETVSLKIAKSTAEFAKLEATVQQNLPAANEALAKLTTGATGALGKAQTAAEQSLARAGADASRIINEAAVAAARAIEASQAAALAGIDVRLSAAATVFTEQVSRELAARLATVAAQAAPAVTPPAPLPSAASPDASAGVSAPAENSPKAESTAHPPKRPRKPRREEIASDEPVAATEVAPPAAAPEPPAAEAATNPPPAIDVAPPEPAPIPTDKFAEVAPVAPHTPEPFTGHVVPVTAPEPSSPKTEPALPAPTSAPAPEVSPPPPMPAADTPAAAPTETGEAPKPPRKRAPKKVAEPVEEVPKPDEEPSLGLDLEGTRAPMGGVLERVLTSDGATRLIVTAYIGIGNRLFIRGAGPGLTWEKGVPLQFVSIGKWRWETNDASGPVQFKLYKNDDVECAALGLQSLEPGYQQELAASF